MATKKKSTRKTKVAGTKKRRSPLQTAYSNLTKTKGKNCDGKATAAQVKAAAKTYIDRAEKAGQTRKEATAKANRVTRRKCAK